jgi:MFS transporter, OFA family, oxalate/formate antiporter
MLCPFFQKNEDYCDVGCGYISPHDVKTMVDHCRSRYHACSRYQQLAARYLVTAEQEAFGKNENAETGEREAAAMTRSDKQKPEVPPFRVKWPLPFRMKYQSLYHSDISIQTKEERFMSSGQIKNKGWSVVVAGLGINLALGILYAYSMLKGEIAQMFSGAGDPYATACLVFAVSMIIGGKMQDKVGPRLTAILGGLLVGAGFFVCSQTSSYWGWILGFGGLAGAGFGFGYSAATPPALKWFSPAKTGLIAGIVVAGFGIAPVYLAPVCKYLLGAYGLHQTMMILGVTFIAIVCGMAMLVTNPPAGFVPEGVKPTAAGAKKASSDDKSPMEMLKEGRFYTCWLTYFIGAGAGLMVIGSIAGIAKKSMGEMAFIAVAVMAIGNASGRVVAGVLSDKIGRAATLTIMLVFQACLMFAAIPIVTGTDSSAVIVTLLATFIGFNYGTNLSLFPSFAKDYWGVKNYGMNYGILFSAWGVGAFVLVKLSAALNAKFGGFTVPFATAGVMLLIGAMMALTLRPKKASVAAEAPAAALEEEDLVVQKAD